MSATATLRTTRPNVGEPSEASKNALAALGATDEQAADNLIKELGLKDGEPANPPLAMTQRTQNLAVTNRFSDMSDGGFEGAFFASELKFPKLAIVQGSGPLTMEHPVGSVILGDERLMEPFDPKAKIQQPGLRVIPWKIKKGFTEDLPDGSFEAGIMPRNFALPSEVEAIGGVVGYNNNGDPRPHFRPSAACFFLVEQPDTELGKGHPMFSQQIGDKSYAVCVYYATKSGYTNCPLVIFQNQLNLMETVGTLPNGKPDRKTIIYKSLWTMRTIRKQKDTFTYVVPEMKLTRDLTPPAVREFIRETLLGQDASTVVEKTAQGD